MDLILRGDRPAGDAGRAVRGRAAALMLVWQQDGIDALIRAAVADARAREPASVLLVPLAIGREPSWPALSVTGPFAALAFDAAMQPGMAERAALALDAIGKAGAPLGTMMEVGARAHAGDDEERFQRTVIRVGAAVVRAAPVPQLTPEETAALYDRNIVVALLSRRPDLLEPGVEYGLRLEPWSEECFTFLLRRGDGRIILVWLGPPRVAVFDGMQLSAAATAEVDRAVAAAERLPAERPDLFRRYDGLAAAQLRVIVGRAQAYGQAAPDGPEAMVRGEGDLIVVPFDRLAARAKVAEPLRLA